MPGNVAPKTKAYTLSLKAAEASRSPTSQAQDPTSQYSLERVGRSLNWGFLAGI